MRTVYDFYSLNSAVRADESEIMVEGKAFEDMSNFLTKMVDYLKKALIYGHTSRISS